jgi:hypothetical protein
LPHFFHSKPSQALCLGQAKKTKAHKPIVFGMAILQVKTKWGGELAAKMKKRHQTGKIKIQHTYNILYSYTKKTHSTLHSKFFSAP